MKCEISINADFGDWEYGRDDYYNIELDGDVLRDEYEDKDIRFYKKIKTNKESKEFRFSYYGNFSGEMNICFDKRSNADEHIIIE